MVKIILNESQLNNLFEYHAQQRLPFQQYSDKLGKMIDDREFSEKNQAEHYLDWLEEFGKYGKIGNSTLILQTCVEKGVELALDAHRITPNNYEYYTDLDSLKQTNIEEISNELMDKFKYIHYDNRGNIYVERAIRITSNLKDVDVDLFNSLSEKYEGNVGGCWAFKPGEGRAYCANESGSRLLLKGYIRLEDIDWLKTCDLNYNQDEYEIRVKPNAKVELFEVIADDKYKLPLQGTLIVSSTYFGNRQGYEKDLATIDDGMGNRTLINRKGEKLNFERVSSVKHLCDDLYSVQNKYGKYTIINSNGEQLINKYFDYIDILGDFFDVNIQDMHCLMDKKGNYICKDWYESIENFNKNNLFTVTINDKYNLLDVNTGELLYDNWYRFIDDIHSDIARVENDNYEISYIYPNGKFITNNWFESGSIFRGEIAVVKIAREEDDFATISNFINKKGEILYPDKWFKRVRLNKLGEPDSNKTYKVFFEGYWYYANKNGIINFDEPFSNN